MEKNSTNLLANLLQTCINNKSYLSGKLIHAHILRTGIFFVDTFLSNRLIELYSKCIKTSNNYTHQFFDTIPRKDVYSWNAILGFYCKSNNLDAANKLFVSMPERNTVSWNIFIASLVRNGAQDTALKFYGEMNLEGFMPTNFTLASVFSACGALMDVCCGKGNHCFAIKVGLDCNVYVSNALLGMYTKCKRMDDAIRVLGDMEKPNEVSFTAMMMGFSETGRVKEALEVFRLMCKSGICIDAVSLSSVLGVCAGIKDLSDGVPCNFNGQLVQSLVIKLGFESDLHLSNSLLDMYAKNGDMKSAEEVFLNIENRSSVSWNIMIAGYGQTYQSEKAIELMQRMQCAGFVPDEVTFINMLAGCAKSGDTGMAQKMFKSMVSPSLISWNSLLSGFSKNEDHKEVIKLFREMQFRCIKSDRTTLAIILSSCAEWGLLESGKQVHAVSIKALYDIDNFVASGLVGMYSKCWKTEKAKCIFGGISKPDIVCWNTMISGLSLNSLDKEALILFKRMRKNGTFPSEFSYSTILSSCAKLSLYQGKQVHGQILKDGYNNDLFVGGSLIEMYCKCGEVDQARLFFYVMPCKNTIIWNEMIHGYAQNGHGDQAICLYNDMIALGNKPDNITFIAVLTACSHSGLVDEGIKIFNSMKTKHGIEPLSDHYTCIIDSLGRYGRFDQIEVIVDTLPYKDDPVIWEVLLSSCRVHGHVTLAKRAAEELFRLNPHKSSPYLLLASSYSSLGEWDESKDVRDLMSDRKITKHPAYSLIQDEDFNRVDEKVEAFR